MERVFRKSFVLICVLNLSVYAARLLYLLCMVVHRKKRLTVKKSIALLLSMILLVGLSTTAFAVPSKTTSDLTNVVAVQVEEGVTVSSNFVVAVEAVDAPETLEVLNTIATKVNSGVAVADVFGAEAKEQIAALLPNKNMSTLTMNEFVAIRVENYDASYKTVRVGMQVASVYTDGQELVAMVLIDGVWYACEAEVVDGVVYTVLDVELLEKMNGNVSQVAILG